MTLASAQQVRPREAEFDDERALVDAARAFDTQAWDSLFGAHYDAIFRYMLLRTGNSHLSEDLAADVFLEAVRGIGRYRHRGVPFRAWLYRIAHNLLASHRRRRTVDTTRIDGDVEVVSSGDHAFEVVERQQLRTALLQLTNDQQQVLALRFFQDLSLEETAVAMGKRTNAIKQLQHRAVARLRQLLEEGN